MLRPVLIGYSCCPLTREAFERQGVRAITCDMLPARDGDTKNHIQGDVWDALRWRSWSAAILHPMCTYLTTSGAWAFSDGPYHQRVKQGTLVGLSRRVARDMALQNFRRLLQLPFPCAIENPAKSFINSAIRPPDQIIHPWQFGDNASKATGLWLTNGMPRLTPTALAVPRLVGNKFRWDNQTDSGQNNLAPGSDRWLVRSKTYPGIADAFGTQYGKWLKNE